MPVVLSRRNGGGATSAPSVPTDLYVSTTGSDTTGNGSSSDPYATVAKALERLPETLDAAYTIDVADGTYNEGIDLRRFVGNAATKLTITGNTTTPANVVFTGTVTYDESGVEVTAGVLVTGNVVAEVEGIQVNVTATWGIAALDYATLHVDRSRVTGTVTRGIFGENFALLFLHGNIVISGFGSGDGISLRHSTNLRFVTAGTLTVTGSGTVGRGIHIYGHSLFRCETTGVNVTVTGIRYGFQLGLSGMFQHITDTGAIVVDNASKPASSAAIYTTDHSSWSTTQALTIDNFTNAFEGNSITYIEAQGSRTITNVTSTSAASQNSVIYLP